MIYYSNEFPKHFFNYGGTVMSQKVKKKLFASTIAVHPFGKYQKKIFLNNFYGLAFFVMKKYDDDLVNETKYILSRDLRESKEG